GTSITQVYAVMSIFVAMYSVLGNMLQAANLTRPAITALVAGLIVKLVTQVIFVALVGPYGMLLSGIAGFAVTCWMMVHIMHKEIRFNGTLLFRRTLLILILSIIMGAVTFVIKWGLGFVFNYERSSHSLMAIAIIAVVGIAVYGYLALKTKLADRLIGP